ncbi:iron-siderophore ABC transporter substrate-binding protein [Zhihengliuella salsuginis]|uniref:Fe3+-hydroxamate ABC transporter substrate-binding protein n=1 Tax=Zhihengliuella salsuginis TaxID=578222 RepID=A0ABQ3GEX0_9MICC|nr:iron-siderophore ABC transporter substrate-binding protein [Zhihengliuella salsuginis]GHD02321.1 Fe3+-hydroxamate ABC transporter substrate-binding protein [Zhihengliuella salsuginis]
MAFTRRAGLLAAAAATVLAASACSGASTASSDSSDAASGGFPVSVESIYGETEIPAEPERVVTLSWVNADTALALGVVPVGMPEVTWGMNENGSTDWNDAKLEELGAPIGSEDGPELYSEADGVNFEAIAELQPDVILAGYSGLTQEDYDKLSKIAPVVGPQKENYLASWQSVTEATGKALGKQDEAAAVIEDVEAQIAAVSEEHPALTETTFIASNLDTAQNVISLYTGDDTRPRFFKALGMTEAPVVAENAPEGEFYFDWSSERGDELDSDVIYTWIPAGSDNADIEGNDLFKQIPAVADGGLFTTNDDHTTLSISAASALSLPWALENYVPEIVETVESVKE